jgi:hypothetical protein
MLLKHAEWIKAPADYPDLPAERLFFGRTLPRAICARAYLYLPQDAVFHLMTQNRIDGVAN